MLKDKLGRELRDIRISVTDRCNFRCFFCMPPEKDITFLDRKELLSYEEITHIVELLTELGVRKVRITGGEPLLRAHIENLVGMLSTIAKIEDVALTTNGYRLDEKAKALKESGLKRVTVSLLSLEEDKYRNMVGKEVSLDRIVKGIDTVLSLGFSPVKVNMVVVRGVNDDEILSIAEFCRDRGIVLRFIEYMDVGTLNDWSVSKVVTAKEILSVLSQRFSFEPLEGKPSETALRYRYKDMPLEFGIVASVSRPFCRGCTRLRLSADGKLFTCLFSSRGFDIKEPLRSGATKLELLEMLKELWTAREDRYSELRFLEDQRKGRVEMFRVGG